MLLSEKSEFNRMLLKLYRAYDKQPHADVFETWFEVFEEFSLCEIGLAFTEFVKSDAYTPHIGRALKFIPSRPRKITSAEAWEHVPLIESESGYVTKAMMQALGTAEDAILRNDIIGAKIAFAETFNSLPPDNEFYYSQAYGVDFEETRQRKIADFRKIASKGWLPNDQKEKIAASLQLKAAPPRKELQHETPDLTNEQKKRNRSRVKNLVDSLKLKDEDGEPA